MLRKIKRWDLTLIVATFTTVFVLLIIWRAGHSNRMDPFMRWSLAAIFAVNAILQWRLWWRKRHGIEDEPITRLHISDTTQS